MNQATQIYQYLKKGKSLNSLQAFKLFGTMKLSSRIGELPLKKGEKVVKSWIPGKKRSYREYRLSK